MEEPKERRFRLFVYGSLLEGERDHGILKLSVALGPVRTAPAYNLFELSAFAAMVEGGTTEIVGELYEVDVNVRCQLDVLKQHPVLFQRRRIRLSDGSEAEAYLMRPEQVRARRRLPEGDWRRRFAPRRSGIPESPWARWARSRTTRS